MKPTDLKFICDACGGEFFGRGDPSRIFVSDIVIDSRVASAGKMFVAIKGEHKDGHDYADDAALRGCEVFLVSRPDLALDLSEKGFSAVSVDNTDVAIRDIAEAYIAQFSPLKIAVTGSVGKTTARQFLKSVFSTKYRTVASEKNYNTHLGLCLTCFLTDSSTQVVIFEMGMDRSGEIREYCEWVRPDAAVITNIGTSHLLKLGSREAIAAAKLEITDFLEDGAPFIFNCDSDFLSVAEIGRSIKSDPRLMPVGTCEEAELRISDVEMSEGGRVSFKLTSGQGGEMAEVVLPIPGVHNAMNASLAIAAGTAFGIPLCEAAKAVTAIEPEPRRLSVHNFGGITVIDDTYNASPESMRAAIEVLASTPASKRIAVLSDMYELGDGEDELHFGVGGFAAASGIDILVAIGQKSAYYSAGALSAGRQGGGRPGSEGRQGGGRPGSEGRAGKDGEAEGGRAGQSGEIFIKEFPSISDAKEYVFSLLKEGNAILFKGSNATNISALASEALVFSGGGPIAE